MKLLVASDLRGPPRLTSATGFLRGGAIAAFSRTYRPTAPSPRQIKLAVVGVLDGIGAGLIAGGGIVLLVTLTAPERPLRMLFVLDEPEAEQARRDRNARAASAVAAVSTFVGAVLLLIGSSAWDTALPAAVAVLAFAWVVLAYEVRGSYMLALAAMRLSMNSRGIVREEEAAYVGIGRHMRVSDPNYNRFDFPINEPEEALRIAEQRTRWRWAMTHPLGARRNGL
jgi:hypothetical protein